jgi:2-methylcitrate dehydratase PrpD
MAVTRARQVVLDTLGNALGGVQTDLGRLTTTFAANSRPGTDASIIGGSRSVSLEGAAWANGILSCILGMTDTHRLSGHVASQVVPAALAVGEGLHLDGPRVITAIAAGYAVFGAIQPMVRVAQRTRGLDHKGQVGTLAAAVTAAVALGLDTDKIAHALALATDMACGTEQYAYDAGLCDTESLLAGYAAANGVTAARMADWGFKGPPHALDGAYGYLRAFGEGGELPDLNHLDPSVGVAGTAFKPHSGCRHVHAAVDATLDILKRGVPPLDTIASIDIGSYKGAVTPEFRVNYHPQTADAAGYSMPVAVAVALVRGGWYREDIEAYGSADVQRLVALTRVYLDDEIEADYPRTKGCVVRLRTDDGQTYEGRVQYPRGEPESMLSDAEFEHKFRRLVGNLLPEDRINQIIHMTYDLVNVADISDLVHSTWQESGKP